MYIPKLALIAVHCGLDPFRYYDWFLRNLPADGEKQKTFDYAPYLPWSESIPDRLRAGHPFIIVCFSIYVTLTYLHFLQK